MLIVPAGTRRRTGASSCGQVVASANRFSSARWVQAKSRPATRGVPIACRRTSASDANGRGGSAAAADASRSIVSVDEPGVARAGQRERPREVLPSVVVRLVGEARGQEACGLRGAGSLGDPSQRQVRVRARLEICERTRFDGRHRLLSGEEPEVVQRVPARGHVDVEGGLEQRGHGARIAQPSQPERRAPAQRGNLEQRAQRWQRRRIGELGERQRRLRRDRARGIVQRRAQGRERRRHLGFGERTCRRQPFGRRAARVAERLDQRVRRRKVEPLRERRVQRGDQLRTLAGAVACLGGIAGQVVQLVDVSVLIVDQLPAAAHQQASRMFLGVRVAHGRRRGSEQPGQAAALELTGARHAEQLEHGRHHVDQFDRRLDRARSERRCADREQRQRHVDLLFIQRGAVVRAAVLAELLAVIGGEHHQGRADAVAHPGGHAVEQPRDLAIGVGDLAVVACARRRVVGHAVRHVRLVRVEVVHPGEGARRRAKARRGQAGEHRVGERVRVEGARVGPFEAKARARVVFERRAPVEEQAGRIKRVGEPVLAEQDLGERGVGAGPLRGGQGGLRRREPRRMGRGEQRGDRERGLRRLRIRALKADRAGRARGDLRKRSIGAQRVDGDQQEVRIAQVGPGRAGTFGRARSGLRGAVRKRERSRVEARDRVEEERSRGRLRAREEAAVAGALLQPERERAQEHRRRPRAHQTGRRNG